MKAKTDPRHEARKQALAGVFCWLFSESDDYQALNLSNELLESPSVDQELVKIIVDGIKKHNAEIDKIITTCAPEWPLEKISKIDLVILRIAVFEVVFGTNTPEKVAIDEAVELAKEFGSDTSSKFVNGVLGAVVELKEKNAAK